MHIYGMYLCTFLFFLVHVVVCFIEKESGEEQREREREREREIEIEIEREREIEI